MLRKSLYPFTDWRWLLLPLGAVVLFGCQAAVLASLIGALVGYGEHAVLSSIAGFLGLQVMLMVAILATIGYLNRVALQPSTSHPHRLPGWEDVGDLLWRGLSLCIGLAVQAALLSMLFALPLQAMGALSLGASILLGQKVHGALGAITALAGLGAVVIAMLVFYFVVMVLASYVVPLLLARYAYTGRFWEMFNWKQAWSAFRIAPWNYLLRMSAWNIYLFLLVVLTPLSAVGGHLLAIPLAPLAILNAIYLAGDYHHEFVVEKADQGSSSETKPPVR